MKIGNIEVGNLILGPMAGFTDMPFRALCIEQGASFTYTEMISAKALYYKNKNTLPLLETGPFERPVAVQLFGSDPELMADEAQKLEEGPYDVFDINMGCPVQKVVGNGEGSALMREPKKAEAIVSAMTRKLKKPVTVKIRKGFHADMANAVEIAKIAEGAGAAAVAVHGRSREEFYRGKSDWNIIAQVKDAVRIPVIGSGDICSGKDARRMLDETGADAVMVARGARGNPWIFHQIRTCLETGREEARPSVEDVRAMILKHVRMMIDFAGENAAIRQMRKHVGFYVAGYPDATWMRREVNQCRTFAEFSDTLTKWNA